MKLRRGVERVGTSAGGWGLALSLAAVLAACGGGEAPAASGVSCGAGTVQKGTTCVPAGEGAGGSTPDDGPITCGPGTVLEGQECVAVDGGTGTDAVSCGPGTVLWDGQCVAAEQVPGAPIIAAFTATKLWGDAPLGTELTWSVLAPSGAALACELDGDGDGVFETSLPACPAAGSHSVTLTQPGKVEPRLRVTASGVTVEATEYLYVNKVDWAPGLVRVRSLPGLVSALDEADDTVVLSFEKAADVSALDGAAVLWDEAPTGFVRKVTSATVKGATVTLATQAGSIFDIATGGFWARREPGASGPQPVGLPISNCEASQLGASYSPQTFGVPEISVVSGDDAVSFTEGKILIGMNVNEPVFDFSAGIFSALATLETRLCGDLTVSGSKDYTKELLVPGVAMGAALDFGLFKASAGFMPRVGFSISGAAQVAFTTVAGARSTLYVARRKDQAPEAMLIVNSQAQILDVVATAEAEAKLYLKPAIELVWGNPQKKCEQSKTKNNGSLKIGVEAELGVKASASVSMSSTGSELCAEAGWYGSAKAQFIPPLEILDCAEISAPLFDKPFYDQCWTLSGGTGGMGGSGGSSGSTTTSTGSGGSSGSTTMSTGSGGAGGSTTTSTGSGGSSGGTTTSTGSGGAGGSGDVAALTVGGHHTCARLTDGTVQCWGSNSNGQLGDGTSGSGNKSITPTVVPGLTGVVELALGGDNTCAHLTGGTVQCWGWNSNGQLGDGTTTNKLTPTVIPGLTGVAELVLSGRHTCARFTGGTVQCSGWNGSGQLGDGTQEQRLTPTVVPGLTGVVELALGGAHTCARLMGGTVQCWGHNDRGQLGDGTQEQRLTPTVVPGLTSVVELAAGYDHTCARLTDGTVQCWGWNAYGQLGDGTTTWKFTPTVVPGLTGVAELALGYQHTCARLTGGTVQCWGINYAGQLGDGTAQDKHTPTVVPGLTGVAELAVGELHTCARLTGGTVQCWGYNLEGQLGDGTTANKLTPTPVVW